MQRSIVVAALGILSTALFPSPASADPPGTVTGTVQQPISAGDPVSVAQQRELGLVTVSGGCSGTLLNQYWVLTADHCVTTGDKIGGPDQPLAETGITATWTTKTATATRFVRYWPSHGLDVALVFLGAGDLGPRDRKLIYHNVVDDSMRLRKFGTGFCSFAKGSGDTAQPARNDCGYLSVLLVPTAADARSIVYMPSALGQMPMAGDSGGPDFVTDGPGHLLSIAGVTSWASVKHLKGKPKAQAWVSYVQESTSAALFTIRDDINRRLTETPLKVASKTQIGSGNVTIERDDRNPLGKARGSLDSVRQDGPNGVVSNATACRSGYVWRAARPSDLVCVTPAARTRTARENDEAPTFVDPHGAYGPQSCIRGYVWREAFQGDLACVTPEARAAARRENAEASTHVR